MFCPSAGLSLQIQHASLYSLLSLPFRIFISFVYHNVVYHLISPSAANFLHVCHSFQSILQQAVPSQPVAQPIYFPLLYQFQHYSSFSHSFQHNCIFILSVHFTRSVLLRIHISNASRCFCSFSRSVQVSAPYNATLHAKQFTSLFLSSFSKLPQKTLLFLLKTSFVIAILCFTS